MQYGTMTLHVA